MKQKLIRLLAIGLLAIVTGCQTTGGTDQTQQRIITASKLAAYLGASEYLRSHPETRPAFEIARDQLRVISTAETLDLTTFLAIVNSLPVKNIDNPRVTMAITAATILLSDYAGSLPVDKLENLKPAAASIADGLDLALGPQVKLK